MTVGEDGARQARPARWLLRTAVRIERLVDTAVARVRGPRTRRAVIDPYLGYSTPTELVARGRLLTSLRGRDPQVGQSRWANLRQMLSLFQTDEVAGVEVCGGGVSAISDEEGYFTLLVPRDAALAKASGWVEIEAGAEGARTRLPVQVTPPDAALGVISDIDDTLLYTGAWQLWRNLWTSFTGNALTRQVFEDAVALIAALSQDGRNPVFYVSSSPWNLHGFLDDVSARAGLVLGPRFLRDLGLNDTEAAGGSHHSHKGGVIDRLMAANPGLRFVLVGDTGQHDAEIYAAAVLRHPGRVARVILRHAGGPASTVSVSDMTAQGVQVDVVADYAGLVAEIAAAAPPGGPA